MRGEYDKNGQYMAGGMELPPRARRILGHTGMETLNNGTTSACAENTPMATMREGARKNYLRVRGEYTCGCGGV